MSYIRNHEMHTQHSRPCRLCGMGEAGAEHLLRWCPVVHGAWQRLTQGLMPPLRKCLTHTQEGRGLVAKTLHQIAFWHMTLGRRADDDGSPLDGRHQRHINLVVGGVVNSRGKGTDPSLEVQERDDGNDDPGRELHVSPCWEQPADCLESCSKCKTLVPRGKLAGNCRMAGRQSEATPHRWGNKFPVATGTIVAGTSIANVVGAEPRGRWALNNRGWWPPPTLSRGVRRTLFGGWNDAGRVSTIARPSLRTHGLREARKSVLHSRHTSCM